MRRGYCRRPSKKLRSKNSYNRMAADRKEVKSILGEEKNVKIRQRWDIQKMSGL